MPSAVGHRGLRLSLTTAFLLVLSVSLAQAQSFDRLCTGRSAPIVQTSDRTFLINGRPTFPVLISYFDAMRATDAALEGDFAFLKSKGIGGVRIFPLWIRHGQKPDATLLGPDGQLRSQERWSHFIRILEKAAACGLIVDVTFNREAIAAASPFSVAEFGEGIAEITRRLKALGSHTHVLIDLQNERDHPDAPDMQLTVAQVKELRDSVKRADSSRIVMASTQGGPDESLSLAQLAELDVIAFHELQQTGWYRETAANVEALKTGRVPIYLQEMARAPDRGVTCARETPEVNPFVEGVRSARRAGAAAWTLHTDAAFRLDIQSFQDELASCPRESDFLNLLGELLRELDPLTLRR